MVTESILCLFRWQNRRKGPGVEVEDAGERDGKSQSEVAGKQWIQQAEDLAPGSKCHLLP